MDTPGIFGLLPYPLKVAAASLKGTYLRAWRFSRHTDVLASAAEERESWSQSDWQDWTAANVAPFLSDAADYVPHYSDMRNSVDPSQLANWPILSKATLRSCAPQLVSRSTHSWLAHHEHTSGTSGTPTTLIQPRRTLLEWSALYESRIRRWNGVDRHDRWAILGGQLVTPFARKRPPYWVWNGAMRQLYLSAYHISPQTAGTYADAIEAHRARYALGYPSGLAALARSLVEAGRTIRGLVVAISNAEPLHNHQRALIEQAFGCPVRDTYGMAEIVAGASECIEGSLHLWPEVGVAEVLEFNSESPVADGSSGRLISTGLLNPAQPLIRYEVGDSIALEPPSTRCGCGRSLPIVRRIEGRTDDLIVTKEGRLIGRLDPVFKADLPIAEAQIIQRDLEEFEIVLVPDPSFGPRHEDELRQRLHARVGAAAVAITRTDRIPRGPNGKFRAVVSEVSEPGS